MNTTRIVIMLSLVLSVLALNEVHATSLRCGTRLITEGDLKSRVLAECGEPDNVEVWEEERVYGFSRNPGYDGIFEDYERRDPNYGYGAPYRIKKLVVVEEWTYNHGPGRFMDHVRLENGIVRDITSGEYGY